MLKAYYKTHLEAGTDEAGRGCLAGPVTAAAVILPKDYSMTRPVATIRWPLRQASMPGEAVNLSHAQRIDAALGAAGVVAFADDRDGSP